MATFAKIAGAVGAVGGGLAYAMSGDKAHARSQFAQYGGQFLFPASSNFPDLSKHNNWMAKVLTPEVNHYSHSIPFFVIIITNCNFFFLYAVVIFCYLSLLMLPFLIGSHWSILKVTPIGIDCFTTIQGYDLKSDDL